MKTIWITGASSGIGEALALEYSKRGYNLILSARTETVLEKVKSMCSSQNIEILPLDLSNYNDFDSLAKKAWALFDGIDLLINNGGISQRSLSFETSISVDEKLMQVNYLGTVALTKAVLPLMLERRCGHIATVSSMVGKFGTPMRSSYAASKHALHGFMDSLRAEVATFGIDVSLVCPGFVQTNVSLNALVGDGKVQGTMDTTTDNGIKASVFAVKMIKALDARKAEVRIAGLKENFGYYLSKFFPSLFRKLVRKIAVT